MAQKVCAAATGGRFWSTEAVPDDLAAAAAKSCKIGIRLRELGAIDPIHSLFAMNLTFCLQWPVEGADGVRFVSDGAWIPRLRLENAVELTVLEGNETGAHRCSVKQGVASAYWQVRGTYKCTTAARKFFDARRGKFRKT